MIGVGDGKVITQKGTVISKFSDQIPINTTTGEYGLEIFDEFVTRQYDLSRKFAQYVEAQVDFELCMAPDANIVCFRYIGKNQILTIQGYQN